MRVSADMAERRSRGRGRAGTGCRCWCGSGCCAGSGRTRTPGRLRGITCSAWSAPQCSASRTGTRRSGRGRHPERRNRGGGLRAVAMTVQAGPIGVPLTGNVLDTFCGSFRSVRPPRGPAAGQAGEQTAPSLPRHTGENDGIFRSGREGRRLGRRWRRSPILDALPVVLLATTPGAGPFAHIRDTTAEHGQHKPMSRAAAHTSTEKERNTTRPAHSDRPAGQQASRPACHTPPRPQFYEAALWARSQSVGGIVGCRIAAVDRAAGGCGGQAGSTSRRQRQPETGGMSTPYSILIRRVTSARSAGEPLPAGATTRRLPRSAILSSARLSS